MLTPSSLLPMCRSEPHRKLTPGSEMGQWLLGKSFSSVCHLLQEVSWEAGVSLLPRALLSAKFPVGMSCYVSLTVQIRAGLRGLVCLCGSYPFFVAETDT